MVEEAGTEALARHLRDSGVKGERKLEGVVGAQGEEEALHTRNPDGYLMELKLYSPPSPWSGD